MSSITVMQTNQTSHPNMNDLLQKVANQDQLKVGNQIKGKIIFLAKNQCLIDIPNIGLGVVRGKELYNEEFLSRLKLDEEIESIIIEMDNELGILELSFREIGKDKIWEEINKAYEEKSTVHAKIRDANRGGFLVKVKGIDGFLPASLLSPTHAIKNVSAEDNSLLNQMRKYVGQIFEVKVISINTESENVIVSEKAVSDEGALIKLQKYKSGDVVEGTIVGVVDFGVFIRFDDDLEGLIHISEIAWKKIEDPRKDYKIGHKVKAKIIDIDKNSSRVTLSIKQMSNNPWVDFSKSTNPGDTFIGTVAKIVPYGIIVVNKDDIQGLCHISQISEDHLENSSKIQQYIKIGETREFKVLSLEKDEKLYLTLLDFVKAMEIQNHLLKQQDKILSKKDIDQELKD
jgi:small subunit ribosomal protein S1